MKTKEDKIAKEVFGELRDELIKMKQIESYWERIGKIEERIQELAKKGINYSAETRKRKSLIANVKRLELEKK